MKITARQIAPEYQTPHLFHISNCNEWIWDDKYYADLAIIPDDYHFGFIAGIIRSVFDVLEAGHLADDLDSLERYTPEELDDYCHYHTRREAIYSYLPPQNPEKEYSMSDIIALCDLIPEYGFDCLKNSGIMCSVLSIVTGNRYEWRTITGSCQGEYADVIYPSDRFDDKAIDALETEYFNMGTEWMLDDLCSVYCYGTTNDDIRSELADAAGCNPSDIEMHKFDGYIHETKYEIV